MSLYGNLLDVKTKDAFVESSRTSSVTNKDDPWMALYCLAIYRAIRANINEYRIQLTNRINSQLKAITSSAFEMTEATIIYLGSINDHQYP